MDAEASRLPSQPSSGVDAIDHLISLQACRGASGRWHGVDWLMSMEMLHFRDAPPSHFISQYGYKSTSVILSSLHNPPEASFPAYTTTSIASSTSVSFDVIYFFQPIQYLSSTPDSDK
jgi:hypothetical protein